MYFLKPPVILIAKEMNKMIEYNTVCFEQCSVLSVHIVYTKKL